jgi:uncharacterized surface anchored protein
MKLKILLLTFFFSAATLIARANTGPGTGEETIKNDIVGGVMHADTKKPLNNVSVTAYTTSSAKKEKVVLTDGNGNYSFNDLKPGTYKIVFEKEGFKKIIREKVTIRSDEGFQLNIEMAEEAAFQILPGGLFFSDLN